MNNRLLFVIGGILVLILAGAFLWKSVSPNGIMGFIQNLQPASTTAATSTATGNVGSGKISSATQSQDVATIASNITGASTFASLFASTGVKATITGKGPYTIFVPTDGAISLLPKGTIQNLSAAQKKQLVQYHIIKGRAVDPAAVQTGFMNALSGDVLNFTVGDDNTPRINSAIVVEAYKGSNGVVYLISQVLFPPTPHVTNQN